MIKKAYTVEELILYIEALEMLDMVYHIEKHETYIDPTNGKRYHDVRIIEYYPKDDEQPVGLPFEK